MKRLIPVAALCSLTISYAESPTRDLFEALRQGDAAKVQAAVSHGVDVNSRDDGGNTLLMQASVYSTPALMQFLLERGADPKASNDRGYTALMRAMPNLVKIKMLLERGADVNAASGEGMTPVIIAASIPTAAETLRYLIKKGANIQAVAQRPGGGDAVMLAATQGAFANLKILLDAGANGRTLRRAPEMLQLPDNATEYALERVARARRNADGTTALMAAAAAGCDACVRILLEGGADIKAKNGTGLTALHHAAFEGNPATVRQLLDAGAVVNIADERGFTPLMMAVSSRMRNSEIPRLLLARGADPAAKDSMGRTVSDWSRIGARPEIMKLFQAEAEIATVKAAATEPMDRDIHDSHIDVLVVYFFYRDE